MAQILHYPVVNMITFNSNFHKILDDFYTKSCDQNFPLLGQKMKQILITEYQLFNIMQEKGRQFMSNDGNLIFQVREIFRQDFLKQNVFSSSDYYFPVEKAIVMMNYIVFSYEIASQTIKQGSYKLNPFKFALLKAQTRPQLIKLQQIKYEGSEQSLINPFSNLQAQLVQTFDQLMNK